MAKPIEAAEIKRAAIDPLCIDVILPVSNSTTSSTSGIEISRPQFSNLRIEQSENIELEEEAMCGRYTLHTDPSEIDEHFCIDDHGELVPRYNISPSQLVAAVRSPDGPRELVMMRWGLIPFWATDLKVGYNMINAKSETLTEKPSYKKPFQCRRCLIVADGFYEWQKTGEKKSDKKQPFYIRMKSGKPFGFAGLWERNEKIGDPIESCTIITTSPNELMATIHDRMPAIIPPEQYRLWLDPEVQEDMRLRHLLQPFPADEMTAYPVSTLVGSPKNDLPQCIEPLAMQKTLLD